VKDHSSAIKTRSKAIVVLLTVPGAPGASVGGNADLGVAVQRHGAAGTEHLLAVATQLHD